MSKGFPCRPFALPSTRIASVGRVKFKANAVLAVKSSLVFQRDNVLAVWRKHDPVDRHVGRVKMAEWVEG